MQYNFKRKFENIEIINHGVSKSGNVLLLGNHFSWWDGFIALYLNNRVFKKKFYVMMLEEQLKKNMFLRKLGAFSVKKKTKSTIESLSYASEILNIEGSLLSLFPQGRIQSQHLDYLPIEKGWFKLVEKAENKFDVVFMVNLIEYFSDKKPTIYINIKQHELKIEEGISDVEIRFNAFKKECVQLINKRAI